MSRKKRHNGGKIVNNFFSANWRIAHFSSENVARAEQSEGQTGDEIVPCMREDAGAQAAAIDCEQAEEHAEDGEQDHVARALIPMRAAEDDGGGEDACRQSSARPADELALQIAAKDGLLDKTDEQAKHGPGGNLSSVGGRELRHLAQHFES